MHIKNINSNYRREMEYYSSCFYYSCKDNRVVSLYSCKEAAVRNFSNLNGHLFRYSKNSLSSLIGAIHRIEDSLKVPHSEFVPIEGEHKLKIIEIRNPFWFSRMIYFDLFCCLFKTLRSLETAKLDKISCYADLPSSNYCKHFEIKWAFENIHSLPEELNLQTPNDDTKFLFSYGVNGMITALRKVSKSSDKLAKSLKIYVLTGEKNELLKKLKTNEEKMEKLLS